jgi:hypothetical protein
MQNEDASPTALHMVVKKPPPSTSPAPQTSVQRTAPAPSPGQQQASAPSSVPSDAMAASSVYAQPTHAAPASIAAVAEVRSSQASSSAPSQSDPATTFSSGTGAYDTFSPPRAAPHPAAYMQPQVSPMLVVYQQAYAAAYSAALLATAHQSQQPMSGADTAEGPAAPHPHSSTPHPPAIAIISTYIPYPQPMMPVYLTPAPPTQQGAQHAEGGGLHPVFYPMLNPYGYPLMQPPVLTPMHIQAQLRQRRRQAQQPNQGK